VTPDNDMNLAVPPPPPPPPSEPRGGEPQSPSDYYSKPPADGQSAQKSGCRKWALGCGGAGCLVLVLVLVVGGYLVTRGASTLIGFVFGEIETLAANSSNLSAEERQEFRSQLDQLKQNLSSDELSLTDLQPLMSLANEAIRDQKITEEEIAELIATMKRLNGTPAEQSF